MNEATTIPAYAVKGGDRIDNGGHVVEVFDAAPVVGNDDVLIRYFDGGAVRSLRVNAETPITLAI